MPSDNKAASVGQAEVKALEGEERRAPDQPASRPMFGRAVGAEDAQSTASQSEDATIQDWAVADFARPDHDDETPDGLNAVEEEVRHVAEDLPADEPWEARVRRKAYELWLSEGGLHGRADDHWRLAAQLVSEEEGGRTNPLPYGDDGDQPVEEASTLENLGEFPGLADQGDENNPSAQSAALDHPAGRQRG